MKKKIISLCLVVCLLATAIVGGTLAYFTDSESATNTITMGNVEIKLYESKYHRGAPTGYLSITDQPNPTTDDDIEADAKVYEDYLAEATLMPFDIKSENRVQSMFEECTVAKNAYVENTGKNDCFVRVIYKVPVEIAPYLDIFYVGTQFINEKDKVALDDARTLNNGDATEPMITNVNTTATNFVEQANKQSADGKYYVAEFIYAERLEPNEFTLYSPVSKITLVPTVTNEIISELKLADRAFDIVVEAQAIQADGFLNAVDAFAAFDAQYVPTAGTTVSNATDLNAALESDATAVVMASDIDTNTNVILNGETLDGAGNTLTKSNPYYVASNYRNAGISPTSGVIKNIIIKGEEAKVDATSTPKSFRAVYAPTLAGNLTIDNSSLIGPAYAFNADGLGTYTLTVTDSVIDGWFSYGGTTGTAVFTNVEFITSLSSYQGFDLRLLRTYGNETTLTNCNFAAGYRFDTADNANTITFVNCTVGGVPVTADNIASFFDVGNCGTGTIAIVDGTSVTIK